jgi:hypothetical protein
MREEYVSGLHIDRKELNRCQGVDLTLFILSRQVNYSNRKQ